jgi:Uncharacterized protein conserved in bacteria (DUF2188)
VDYPDEAGCANKRAGARRASRASSVDGEAQAAGRNSAMRDKVEHLVETQTAKVAERNSYGDDRCGG